MSTTRAILQQLNPVSLEATIMKEIITRDELFNFLPFKQVNSLQHQYNRQLTLGSTNVVDPILPNGTWSESTPTFTTVTDNIKIFADSAYVPRLGLRNPEIYGPLVQAKGFVIARSFAKALVSGSGGDPQFKGLVTEASMSVRSEAVATAGTGSLTLSSLDTLLSKVDAGPASFILCNTTNRNRILNLIRGSYSQPNFIQSQNLGSGPVLLYNGVPVIVNDYIDNGATSVGSPVLAVYANELDGVTGWYKSPADLMAIDEVPVNQSDMVEVQVKMRAGFSIQSTHALYAITGVIS